MSWLVSRGTAQPHRWLRPPAPFTMNDNPVLFSWAAGVSPDRPGAERVPCAFLAGYRIIRGAAGLLYEEGQTR